MAVYISPIASIMPQICSEQATRQSTTTTISERPKMRTAERIDGLLDCWMNGLLYEYRAIDGFMEYTKRRNLNRGYMKLALISSLELKRENHTWQDAPPRSQESTHPTIQ